MKKKVVSLLLVLGALAATAALATSGFAAGAPTNDQLHIKKISYGGTGCPAGTVSVNLSPDQTAFTLIFDQFLAQIGPGISLSESRKNCQVNLSLHVPHGFTFAIASVDYRGYANIANGSTGEQKASYYFQGQAPTASAWTTFHGAYDDNWQVRDQVAVGALVWSPCGEERSLNINAQLRLAKGSAPASASSIIAMDSEDGNLQQIYHLVWATCPGGPAPGPAPAPTPLPHP